MYNIIADWQCARCRCVGTRCVDQTDLILKMIIDRTKGNEDVMKDRLRFFLLTAAHVFEYTIHVWNRHSD